MGCTTLTAVMQLAGPRIRITMHLAGLLSKVVLAKETIQTGSSNRSTKSRRISWSTCWRRAICRKNCKRTKLFPNYSKLLQMRMETCDSATKSTVVSCWARIANWTPGIFKVSTRLSTGRRLIPIWATQMQVKFKRTLRRLISLSKIHNYNSIVKILSIQTWRHRITSPICSKYQELRDNIGKTCRLIKRMQWTISFSMCWTIRIDCRDRAICHKNHHNNLALHKSLRPQ